ncbi:hypothetical protein [Butyrivibrio sp. JL13D10]|uniref:hypothetical protein n=1 Tax=Butyrivibrio sp. JL13D10 TaxID=3236815 RepID=UPI0038B54443
MSKRNSNTFTIENYGRKTTFASFLPGIAGLKGIPIWCYYVNRGQAVVSFGVDNKDHAIMEFYPAHTAYQNVKRTGFRTFIKKNGNVYESFSLESNAHCMEIGMNCLTLKETNDKNGIQTKVTYFVLPEEPVGGLVRRVEITNISDTKADLEIIDGMPALIPYGISLDSMKNMAQLSKAWMQVEENEKNLPFYRVRASMVDTASVSEVKGGNFSFAINENGTRLDTIVDPDVVFGYDNSLQNPVEFMENSLDEVLNKNQNKSNLIPSGLFACKKVLDVGESTVIYELIGQVEEYSILDNYIKTTTMSPEFFEYKLIRAQELTEELTQRITTTTGSTAFDDYTRYTFMDNVLRGGLPVKLGKDKIFYVYSRKHGDLEREYNYFAMSPEFYSQGNGNFRDVNQNRRMDSFFAPYTGNAGIKMFYSLIQADGYNPLSIEKITYSIADEKLSELETEINKASNADKIFEVIKGKHFTPGKLALICEDELFTKILDVCDADINASFGEGYWTDHWTYNLDLIEEYISIYPDKEKELLFEKDYTYFASEVKIRKRSERYAETEAGVRQYYALDETSKRKNDCKLLMTDRGDVYRGTLLEKLILMSALKYAALDPGHMGIEMEGGKPGWYDALNGLPGIFGSSMAETYELSRMLEYTIGHLKKYESEKKDIELFAEIFDFISDIAKITDRYKDDLFNTGNSTDTVDIAFWNEINDRKEKYRDDVFGSISGEIKTVNTLELAGFLEKFKSVVDAGIDKAFMLNDGFCPTYFYYDVTDYTKDEQGIHPTSFTLNKVPAFLEGPVRYLKLSNDDKTKHAVYDKVKNSDLFDKKLNMYKINAPLASSSYELGRCRCFTPGWLENESIWLHMEYKYLLEVIKSGMFREFAEDFHNALIPFMDPDIYGRSILENSSFIASSANPNEAIHGKGFVARLSGSTIEFLSMWKLIMFGSNPFIMVRGELVFKLEPTLPKYLISDINTVSARFMSSTDITYHFSERKDYFPGEYTVQKIVLKDDNGEEKEAVSGVITGKDAELVRDGSYRNIDVYLV